MTSALHRSRVTAVTALSEFLYALFHEEPEVDTPSLADRLEDYLDRRAAHLDVAGRGRHDRAYYEQEMLEGLARDVKLIGMADEELSRRHLYELAEKFAELGILVPKILIPAPDRKPELLSDAGLKQAIERRAKSVHSFLLEYERGLSLDHHREAKRPPPLRLGAAEVQSTL